MDRDYMKPDYNRHDYVKAEYNKKSRLRSPRIGHYNFKNIFWKVKRNLLLLTVVWVIFILFALPVLETSFATIIEPLGFIFILISLILGFYQSYRLVVWIDRKLPNTEFGLWSRRGISSILVLVGLGFAFLWMFSFSMTMALSPMGKTSIILVSIYSLSALIFCFCLGLAVFAGYMEFTFERRAGIIVFQGRQRF